jgi:hypothetical protein
VGQLLSAAVPGRALRGARFRPNIAVSTEPDRRGFADNDWIERTIAVGDEVRL